MGVEILNKIQVNQIQQHIKNIINYDQVRFIPGIQEWFNTWSKPTWYSTLREWKIKIKWLCQLMQKNNLKIFNMHFIIKLHGKLGIAGNHLNKKWHGWKTHWWQHSQCYKTESIPFKIKNKAKLPKTATSTQHNMGSLSHSNQIRKR